MNAGSRKIGAVVLGVILVCILCYAALVFDNDIGVQSSGLEADLRSSQGIKEDWLLTGTASDEMAAYIAYPEDRSDHTFSFYVNRPGLSFGYFFRSGGSLSEVGKYIAEFTMEGYHERAFISMNRQNAARLEVDDGTSVQVTELDSDQPFAIILPVNAGTVTFFDVQGNEVDYYRHPV